jgi:hypothetical protein
LVTLFSESELKTEALSQETNKNMVSSLKGSWGMERGSLEKNEKKGFAFDIELVLSTINITWTGKFSLDPRDWNISP